MICLIFFQLFIMYFALICSGEYLEIVDKEYAQMPELFHLDNFDQCKLLGDDFMYCTFTYKLMALNESNPVWKTIQVVNENPQNYNHDKLRHGVCVPTSCPEAAKKQTLAEVKSEIELCYNSKYLEMEIIGNITSILCQTEEEIYPIDIYDIVVAGILVSYIAFVICASLFEKTAESRTPKVCKKLIGSKCGKILSAFSLPKNWERLRSKNHSPEGRKLRCIQGIRFYNMICVILAHTIMVQLAGPVSNPRYVENVGKKILNAFIINGSFAVQTFFVISGWLLSYHFFEMMEKRKTFEYKYLGLALINRYMRLTPCLAIMIAFSSTWLVRLSSGPNWDLFVSREYRNCRKNWWTNLLYINNYVDQKHMCLIQTWYIASDTQLFILSTLILAVIWKNPKMTKIILGAITAIGIAIPGIIAFCINADIVVRQYPELLYKLNNVQNDLWITLYTAGHTNVGGYMIGLIFGYIFFQYRNTSLNIRKIHIILWWILTFGLCIFIVLIGAKMYDPLYTYSVLESALYWSFGKNVFAFGIAIAIFGFTKKIGWFARWFVEWDCVEVLGRLTYSSYMVHTTFIRVKAGYSRYPVSANDNMLIFDVLGNIVLAYLFGTIICLTVEMPLSALQKLMIPPVRTIETTNQTNSRRDCLKKSNNICSRV